VANSVASPQSRSRPKPVKRYGSETPRIFTPPLRKLTPKTSLGFSVIEFAETVLEIDLLPWQRWLLIHMLELLPDNSLRFRTVIVLVARQNGKSTLSQVVALWFMYVYGVALVIGTAQDLDVAEEIWQGAVDLAEESEDLSPLIERVIKVNGKKALELKNGERYKVKAANRRAGRGLSGDVILLDELREHQSWDAWGAITKTTMARAMALILALSNAGDATSIVLRYLRKMTHAALGDPDGINADDDPAALLPEDEEPDEFEIDEDDDSVAIFEWSAPPGCDIRDRDGWAAANPAMGYTITERTIASAARTDPEWIFRTEVLCQWSEGSLEGPFPPDSWERSADEQSKRANEAEIALCVDVSWDRSTSHIGLASTREDGNLHVEVIASRTGTEWVVGWLTSEDRSEAVREAPVAVQAKGAPASSLIQPLKDAGVDVVEWGGSDLGAGTGAFYDKVRAAVGEGDAETGIRHRNQPLLNIAAANAATKPAGDAWWWDRRKSPVDVSPLIAVTGAAWCLASAMPEKPTESVYESRGLVTL
jgi:phage terminase large subunit-like protein